MNQGKTIHHKNFIRQCALHILKNTQNEIVIVPEKTHGTQIRTILAEECASTIEPPTILSVEGLDISPFFPFEENVISRNSAFAVLMELTERAQKLPENEIPTFVRALIGELPNLYAQGFKPNDLLTRLPSTIPTEREININLCVAVWNDFEVYLQENKQIPYYATSTVMLKKLIEYAKKTNKSLVIVDDFGRSPILQKFINKAKQLPNTLVFSHDAPHHKQEIYSVQSNHFLEEKNVSLVVKYLLSHNEEAKIGIVCEDEQTQRNIAIELQSQKIPCTWNISKPAESNPLVRAFLLMLQNNFSEILPILKPDNINKQEIIGFIVEEKPCNVEIWREILNVAYTGDVNQILSFITKKSWYFITSNDDHAHFFQFKTFLENEFSAVKKLGIKLNKSLVFHISSSWKIFQNTQKSSVVLCKLRDLHLHSNWDAVILTSSYKIEPKSNMIFSTGMKKYYGLELHNPAQTLLEDITSPIFLTSEITELTGVPIFLTEESPPHKKHQNAQISISHNEIPQIIPATWLETLFVNPLLFYYQYIKNLREISYRKSDILALGNIVHSILEKATHKVINGDEFDCERFAIDFFTKEKCPHMAIFYLEDIIKTLAELPKNAEILPEKNSQYHMYINGVEFTITSRADRIDLTYNGITIYDYKTGSNKNFTQKLKKLEKIQLLIPACASNLENKTGIYKFIGSDDNITQDITEELLEKFQTKTEEFLQRYCINLEPLEAGKEFNGYHHAARI